jgi:hypothetical protein
MTHESYLILTHKHTYQYKSMEMKKYDILKSILYNILYILFNVCGCINKFANFNINLLFCKYSAYTYTHVVMMADGDGAFAYF